MARRTSSAKDAARDSRLALSVVIRRMYAERRVFVNRPREMSFILRGESLSIGAAAAVAAGAYSQRPSHMPLRARDRTSLNSSPHSNAHDQIGRASCRERV